MAKIYDCAEGCPVETTLQFISGKWKSVMLYRLFNEHVLRFSDFQKKLPSVSKRMIAKQLAELESDQLIEKTIYPEAPVRTEYRLTKFGKPLHQLLEPWRSGEKGMLSWKQIPKPSNPAN